MDNQYNQYAEDAHTHNKKSLHFLSTYELKFCGRWLFWLQNNPIEIYTMWFLIIAFIVLILCIVISGSIDREEIRRVA